MGKDGHNAKVVYIDVENGEPLNVVITRQQGESLKAAIYRQIVESSTAQLHNPKGIETERKAPRKAPHLT